MKKFVLLCMSLIILFSSCWTVLANPKGDPLLEHDEYVELLRQWFEHTETKMKSAQYSCVWKKEPSFVLGIWSNDYRTVRVYNIPHLMSTEVKDNFLRESFNAILQAREVSEISKKIAKNTGKAVIKIFGERLKNRLNGFNALNETAKFLGTDIETALDSFIIAFGMACISQILHGVSVVVGFADIFGVINLANPIGLALATALDIACFTTTKSALAQEKILNYSEVLSTVYKTLLEKPDHILKSNVLVSAVDERNFYSLFRWNAFRRNDGAWCNFVFIGGLKCAPIAKDYDKGKIITTFSGIYNQILRDGKLDYKEIDRFNKTGIISVDRLLSDPDKETSEASSPSSSKVEEIV